MFSQQASTLPPDWNGLLFAEAMVSANEGQENGPLPWLPLEGLRRLRSGWFALVVAAAHYIGGGGDHGPGRGF